MNTDHLDNRSPNTCAEDACRHEAAGNWAAAADDWRAAAARTIGHNRRSRYLEREAMARRVLASLDA